MGCLFQQRWGITTHKNPNWRGVGCTSQIGSSQDLFQLPKSSQNQQKHQKHPYHTKQEHSTNSTNYWKQKWKSSRINATRNTYTSSTSTNLTKLTPRVASVQSWRVWSWKRSLKCCHIWVMQSSRIKRAWNKQQWLQTVKMNQHWRRHSAVMRGPNGSNK